MMGLRRRSEPTVTERSAAVGAAVFTAAERLPRGCRWRYRKDCGFWGFGANGRDRSGERKNAGETPALPRGGRVVSEVGTGRGKPRPYKCKSDRGIGSWC